QRLAVDRGAILFDPERVDEPGWGLFDRDRWQARHALTAHTGGRGSIHFIEDRGRHWALRRYLRGGIVAHFVRERFLFLGEDRTRSFLELRLLSTLLQKGLPVPAPVAAGYRRRRFTYVAELITERLAGAASLTEMLRAGRMNEKRWAEIGHCLRRFHDAGVQHADLTANNIMLGEEAEVWLLDFDRGRVREPGAWRERVLNRLARSLEKVTAGGIEWQSGYSVLRSSHDG
ncbi:MAG: 3-deoxy-D-manno-octulosonic acid kinase, partial [Gammaproteobacteria bacterium]|nr:3-deoxy-D-manno-octulosonic acid kinase [Gammaproteobacteria bacterium]